MYSKKENMIQIYFYDVDNTDDGARYLSYIRSVGLEECLGIKVTLVIYNLLRATQKFKKHKNSNRVRDEDSHPGI